MTKRVFAGGIKRLAFLAKPNRTPSEPSIPSVLTNLTYDGFFPDISPVCFGTRTQGDF